MSNSARTPYSPWHEGELAVQERASVRQEADELRGMYKRSFPSSMAGFLSQQQFAVLSTADAQQQVWASLIAGSPGMIEIRTPDSIALAAANIETALPVDDIQGDQAIGLIVIDFSRRIRVRINGVARVENDGAIVITIEQLYGNCSQYIQRRVIENFDNATHSPCTATTTLSESQRLMIQRADTFFIASRHPSHGADASHRGGKPGFVQLTSPTRLSFPDYSGNNMFNTLGNVTVNPAVGLLFVDFESGRALQLSGRAQVDWDHNRSSRLEKAKRVIDVDIDEVRDTERATSLRYRFIGYSPTLE